MALKFCFFGDIKFNMSKCYALISVDLLSFCRLLRYSSYVVNFALCSLDGNR